MIPRPIVPLLLCGMLAACDRPPPAQQPEPRPAPAPAPEPPAQSIMQPRVIAETQPVPEPAPAPATLPGTVIGFASGARLDDAGRAAIDRLLAEPTLPADARFVLRGHSDALGSDADNLRTSRRRALAVRDYLVGKGVADDRIEVIALGERRPVAPNALPNGADDPAGRARNRRVEIEVVAAEAPAPAPPPKE